MNNEDVKDRKLAKYVFYTFEVPELQVDVVEGDWKHLICDTLKSRRKRPVLEV
jgi:hypothetical protein